MALMSIKTSWKTGINDIFTQNSESSYQRSLAPDTGVGKNKLRGKTGIDAFETGPESGKSSPLLRSCLLPKQHRNVCAQPRSGSPRNRKDSSHWGWSDQQKTQRKRSRQTTLLSLPQPAFWKREKCDLQHSVNSMKTHLCIFSSYHYSILRYNIHVRCQIFQLLLTSFIKISFRNIHCLRDDLLKFICARLNKNEYRIKIY